MTGNTLILAAFTTCASTIGFWSAFGSDIMQAQNKIQTAMFMIGAPTMLLGGFFSAILYGTIFANTVISLTGNHAVATVVFYTGILGSGVVLFGVWLITVPFVASKIENWESKKTTGAY